MIKLKKHKVLLIITAFFLFLGLGCENLEEDFNINQYKNPVRIGVVGDVSVLREQVENIFFGAKLASEEINNQGGIIIQGEESEIELIFKNSAGDPAEGIIVANELIQQGVDIIVGPTFSSVAIEMADLCVKNNILMMSYSATTPELSLIDDNDLVWRTCPSDYTFGHISAQYGYDSLQARKAAVLYRNDRYGQGLADIIENNFVEQGGIVTQSVSFPGDIVDLPTYDFSHELNTLMSEEIDIIYIIAFNSEIGVLTNKIYNNPFYQSFDKKPYVFVNDGIIPEEIIVNGNPELINTVIGITSTNEENENYTLYKTNYTKRFGFSPATYSEHAYDAIYCLAYAMLKANSTEPDKIAEVLREVSGINDYNQGTSNNQIIINVGEYDIGKSLIVRGESINYEGASGPISFDYFGDPVPKMVIWGIKNNQSVELSYYGK